jgi:hypothetical protein
MVSGLAQMIPEVPHERASAPEREHALRLLLRHGLPVRRVVGVDVDSVLYVTIDNRPRTAWLAVRDATLVIHDEAGFSAEPPPYASGLQPSAIASAPHD